MILYQPKEARMENMEMYIENNSIILLCKRFYEIVKEIHCSFLCGEIFCAVK